MAKGKSLKLKEIGNTYVSSCDRFVVSLVVGCNVESDGVKTPKQALAAALDLTTDEGSCDTHWYVFDRQTGDLHLIEQGDAEAAGDEDEDVDIHPRATVSPETTGVYVCHHCGNKEKFTGYDDNGFPGNECECESQNGTGIECTCKVTLTQDFTVAPDGELIYQAHVGGGNGADIGTYNRIECGECGEEIWNDEWAATPTPAEATL